jgi:hypothetical protein
MTNGSGNKIGEAFVELRARVDKLESDLAAARAASAKTADQMGTDAKRGADGFKRGSDDIEDSVKRQASAFTSLLGRVTAVVAAMVSFHRIGTKIREMFIEDAASKSETFLNSIANDDMATRLKKVTAEIDELNARATASRETFSGFWANAILGGEQASDIEQRVAKLLPTQTSLRQAIASANRGVRDSLRQEESRKDLQAYQSVADEISKIAYDNQQNISDAEAEASTRAREKRIADAKAWTEAEKQSVDELREYESGARLEAFRAQRAIDEDIRRSHEAFRRQMFESNSVDIRQMEHMLRRLSLNGSR